MSKEPDSLNFLDEDNLKKLVPVLSDESYNSLQEELKRLKDNAPPVSGIGIDHHGYIPEGLEECKEKIKRLNDRLSHTKQVCFFLEILEREARRKMLVFESENLKLKEENRTLQEDIKRAYNQIQETLGVKKDKAGKKKEKEKESSGKRRGAPKGHTGRTRAVPASVDKTEIIGFPDKCPCCNSSDIFSNGYISKYVEDVAPVVREVTEKKFVKGTCANCDSQVVSPEATIGPPVIIGDNLISLLSVMREQMGVSLRKLSRFVTETFKIPISQSGVLGILNRVSRKLEPIYKGIEISLRTQSVLHGDETGWNMDGQSWYWWCFCNKTIVYFHPDASRGSKVPKGIIGEEYSGIFHSDFYGAYNFIKKKQRCLVHFVRDIKEELEVRPDDNVLIKLKEEMYYIIERGKELQMLKNSKEKSIEIKKLENKLDGLMKLESENKKTKNLIERIIKHREDMLRFIYNEEAEHHNNRAERTIRAAVIFRKISFGNRTPQGAHNYAILTSVLETCRLKGEKLLSFLQNILVTPNNKLHIVTKSLLDTS